MFSFTRFYLRVLADLNEIIRRRKRCVILRIAIMLKNLGEKLPEGSIISTSLFY